MRSFRFWTQGPHPICFHEFEFLFLKLPSKIARASGPQNQIYLCWTHSPFPLQTPVYSSIKWRKSQYGSSNLIGRLLWDIMQKSSGITPTTWYRINVDYYSDHRHQYWIYRFNFNVLFMVLCQELHDGKGLLYLHLPESPFEGSSSLKMEPLDILAALTILIIIKSSDEPG